MEENNKYCHSCGSQINKDVKFCPSCGADQNNTQPAKEITSSNGKKDTILELAIMKCVWWLNALSTGGQLVYGLTVIISVVIILFVNLGYYGKGYFYGLALSGVAWSYAYRKLGNSTENLNASIEGDEVNQRELAHAFRKQTIFFAISFVFLILQIIIGGYLLYETYTTPDYDFHVGGESHRGMD